MIPNSSYDITGWRSGGRQSLTYNLKAGQMRGMGTGRIVSNNVFINNYAPMPMHTAVDMHCCGGGGMSGFEKWMLGIGGVGSILGAIFGALGIGGGGGAPAEGAGGVEEKPNDDKYQTLLDKIDEQQKAIDKLQKQLAKPASTQAAPADTEQAAPETKPTGDFHNGQTVKVHDEVLGTKADISGTVTVNNDGTISIKDVINTYTYKKESTTVNYKGVDYPVYTLTGAVNNQTGANQPITSQQYILMNGQLVQPSDLDLSGLGIGSVQKGTSQTESTGNTANTTNNANTTTQATTTNSSRATGVPYKNLNNYDSISDPSVRGNAQRVDDAINKLPENKRGTYRSQLEQIIKDFGNSNDFGAKMQTNTKLNALLNNIAQIQGANTSKTQTNAPDPNKPFIGSRQSWL